MTGRNNDSRLGPSASRAAVVSALAAMLLFFRSQPRDGILPECIFYTLTGWQCPGCGGVRALHDLAHGQFLPAVQDNLLVVIALLTVVGWLLAFPAPARVGHYVERYPGTVQQLSVLTILVVVGYGVIRNFPGFDGLRAY